MVQVMKCTRDNMMSAEQSGTTSAGVDWAMQMGTDCQVNK